MSEASQSENVWKAHPSSPQGMCYLQGYRFDRKGLGIWISEQSGSTFELRFAHSEVVVVETDPFDVVGAAGLSAVVSFSDQSEFLSKARASADFMPVSARSDGLHVVVHAREFALHVITDELPVITPAQIPAGGLFDSLASSGEV